MVIGDIALRCCSVSILDLLGCWDKLFDFLEALVGRFAVEGGVCPLAIVEALPERQLLLHLFTQRLEVNGSPELYACGQCAESVPP